MPFKLKNRSTLVVKMFCFSSSVHVESRTAAIESRIDDLPTTGIERRVAAEEQPIGAEKVARNVDGT